ncbi:MAG: indole-3-glycerol phosphate synthase TrpC [Neisseriaceae bacterium]|nr:indole-3-glycerol phosphate synthase TrpC [Neisseriaceae bacterium]
MNDILSRINQRKAEEIGALQKKIGIVEMQQRAFDAKHPRNFLDAIVSKHSNGQVAVIAEIKKASPSKGLIRKDFRPSKIAIAYEKANAACISVLTDEDFFQGHIDFIEIVKQACNLPVLRKDFIIDPYQVYQARAFGADAILLIASSLSTEQLIELESIAHELKMTVLVELHHEDELEKCQRLTSPLFGVNNRNLRTFEVDTKQTLRLLPLLQNKIVVCESGIKTHDDIVMMGNHGVHTFLVGETLMRQENVEYALRNLLGINN